MGLKSAIWVGCLAAAGLVSWTGQAGAQSVMWGDSNTTINFGPYTVSVYDCPVAQCSSMKMTALASNDGFVISSTGSGALLYASGSLADVSVTFEVTTTVNNLSQVVLQVSGGATGSGFAQVTGNVNDINYNYGYSGNAAAGGSPSVIALSDGPFSGIYIQEDISAHATGGTATINSVTQSFSVPEPGGLSVLSVGLMAMLLPKRRRR